jgi:hypothetical protein
MKKRSYKFLPLQIFTVTGFVVRTWGFKLFVATFILGFLNGCASIGPETVARDRFGYTDAISDSWKRQMLLNVVKMRYADPPVFLDVTSVINQYVLETELQGGLSWNAFLALPSQNVGARSKYADRPTITYQPLRGEKFTRSLMTPIPPSAVMSLIQAGWRADASLMACVQAVNGIYNRRAGGLKQSPADPEFYKLTASFRKIQESRAMGIRIIEKKGKKPETTLFFRKNVIDPDTKAEIDTLKKLLGLDQNRQEFKVLFGSLAQDDEEIIMHSRSMLEILLDLAAYIEIPQTHMDEQRATPNIEPTDAAAGPFPLIQIKSNTEKPDDAYAYVSVPYRDHWFWIDDRDFQSKRTFSFLMFLLSLAETGAPEEAPVLTIPAG